MVFFKTDNDKERAKQIFRLKDNKVSTIFYGIIAKDYSRKIDARQFICNKHQIGKQEKIILFAGTPA